MEKLEITMTKVNSKFWKGKKVFLTGHSGFKGSWLSIWLQAMGAEIKGFSLAPHTSPSLFIEANVAEHMESFVGDIRNKELVFDSMKKFNPDIVIHMAAQPLVRTSYREPIDTYHTNIMGTLHVLEAARYCNNLRALINVTTDKCYANNEWEWGYRENEPMGGFDPYSSSKACSELVTSAYRSSFFQKSGISVATARAGNVIGGGDWSEDRLIPDIFSAFKNKQPVIIRNPKAIRPWQHVLEPLSGYLVLAEKLYTDGKFFAEAWNFGPNDQDVQTVQWIVEKMTADWNLKENWIIDNIEQPHEANYLKLDISKARNKLGWEPSWHLPIAIEKIIKWHKSWLSGINAQALCLEQIKEFQNSVI